MADLVRGMESQSQRREISAREAGPYLQLMSLPLAADSDIIVDIPVLRNSNNREALKKMAGACNVVLLLQDPLLPSLRSRPTDAAHLNMMNACAQKLKEYGRAVGGSFNVSCMEFAQRISSYARGHSSDSIDDLLCQASQFLDMTYTPDAAEAEAGGDN